MAIETSSLRGFGLGVAQPGRRPSNFGQLLGGRGPLGLPEGPNGPKMVCFAPLSATRSRQDESKEVHEVGSKRPSSGCNGVHVVWCSGLIFWLLVLAAE